MRRKKTSLVGVVVILLLALAIVIALGRKVLQPKEEIDPHEGQVLINDGYNDVWITPLEGVEVNELKKEDFDRTDDKIVYTGEDYDTMLGVDVSEHQRDIDWEKVAQSGVKFAYIRSGYRGYTKGSLTTTPGIGPTWTAHAPRALRSVCISSPRR